LEKEKNLLPLPRIKVCNIQPAAYTVRTPNGSEERILMKCIHQTAVHVYICLCICYH